MRTLICVLSISGFLALSAGLGGCETSHTESTKQNLLGGSTHEETTTYKNPDGTVSVDHSKEVTH